MSPDGTIPQIPQVPVSGYATWTAATPTPIGSSGPPDSFKFFPLLPPELRIIIWSMYGGRVLPIIPGPAATGNFYTLPHTPPTLFRVCQEARLLAQATHELVDLAPNVSGTSDSKSSWNDTSEVVRRSVWVDWSKDTIFLVQPRSQGSMLSAHCVQFLRATVPGLKSIRNLAIEEHHFEDADQLCDALPSIQSITIIQHNDLGQVGQVVNGRSSMRHENMDNFYLVRSSIDFDFEKGLRRYQLFDAWTSFWDAYGSTIKARVRFCDLIQDDSRRDEKLESEEGLREMASITLDDFVLWSLSWRKTLGNGG